MIPATPPPRVVPRYVQGLNRIDDETLRQFLRHYIFCWMKTRQKFWFCPIDVNAAYMEGYVWHRDQWQPMRLYLSMIDNYF